MEDGGERGEHSKVIEKMESRNNGNGYLGGDDVASSEDVRYGFGQSHLLDELVRHFSLLSSVRSCFPPKPDTIFVPV